jgi:hypothetical protein
MTQREQLRLAIDHLEKAIDIFPDKDDEIIAYNSMLYAIITMLKTLMK